MLTGDQICTIEQYCESKGIRYYDVRQELLDHMYELIENEQEINGSGFETAFEKMKSNFSDQDFREMVRSKSRSVSILVAHNCIKEFQTFFSWPKIAITATMILVVILINRYANISMFPAYAIHFFNLINGFFVCGTDNTIYHNRFNKVAKLVSVRQLNRMKVLFLLPSISYMAFSIFYWQGVIIPMGVNKVALFSFPLLILLNMAWRSAYIDANEKIRHDYPGAFRLR